MTTHIVDYPTLKWSLPFAIYRFKQGIIAQWSSAFSETKGSEWEPNLLAILWGPYALEN